MHVCVAPPVGDHLREVRGKAQPSLFSFCRFDEADGDVEAFTTAAFFSAKLITQLALDP